MRAFEKMHPMPCFLYFLTIIGVTIFSRDPVILAESLIGAVTAAVLSERAGALPFLGVTAAVVTFTNPLFSHNGVTVLFFVGDLAVTLEALVYGLAFAVMLCAAVMWGAVSTRFLTSDKYVWLFGRVLPSAGLVLSCAMRFVPLFVVRTRGFIGSRGAKSVRKILGAFSASLSYSAEEAMTTADAMKSRGYGTARRTFYSSYRLTGRDVRALTAVLVCGLGCVSAAACGAGQFYYYPAISAPKFAAADVALYVCFGILCALPSALIIAEEIKRNEVIK
ncbi:MAG: energy-coupling factor transporter transmembrane protein EcfT [Oscillospiraceae bacterium]|nr:energy-coupling factor transporter transmembrane protein EcfT [Oscillospiraceae bacterium]